MPSGSRDNHRAGRAARTPAINRGEHSSSAGRLSGSPADGQGTRSSQAPNRRVRLHHGKQAEQSRSTPERRARARPGQHLPVSPWRPRRTSATASAHFSSDLGALQQRLRPASVRSLQVQTVFAARRTHHFAPSPLMSVDILMVGAPVPDLLVPNSNRVPSTGPVHLMLVKAHLRLLRCRLSAVTVTGPIPQYQLNPRRLLQGRSTNAENSYGH